MADLLSTGAAWLSKVRKDHASRTVTYKRGADEVELEATKGASPHSSKDQYGFAYRVKSVDWLLTAADLILDGSETTPQRGDIIEEVIDGTTFTYEVMPFGEDPEWRWSDVPAHTTMRVHTKEIS